MATDTRHHVQQLRELPAMPDMAARLLRLRNARQATVGELADLVETDPSLAAKLTAYARSAFFGYRGRVETIREAVTQVLGFDAALNLALGLAVSRVLRHRLDGPLGIHAFWRHAVRSARLAQRLCLAIPAAQRPRHEVAYLAALLHDLGLLVMSKLFEPEFTLLNRTVATYPDVPLDTLERRVLGMKHARMNHAQIGAWLMEAWQLPDEVVTAMREHHNPHYRGVHEQYVGLVMLADRLLAGREEEAAVTADFLGIAPQVAAAISQETIDSGSLDALARQLAAA